MNPNTDRFSEERGGYLQDVDIDREEELARDKADQDRDCEVDKEPMNNYEF